MKKEWSVSIGLYPGVLFGFRTYETVEEDLHKITHVIYLPLIDIAIETIYIENEEVE